MTPVERVLPRDRVVDLADYQARGGGRGLAAARRLGPAAIIEELEAAGLRGRGGAGFPTGTKWRTVAAYASSTVASTVVVNGAEGEPGSFKDREILRRTPYAVLEGALIAALAVGADRAVIALKSGFDVEKERLETAIVELGAAGWTDEVNVGVMTGPAEYLFGEETALLEVLDGRPPFPRIAPPFRHGLDEVGPHADHAGGTVMADEGRSEAPPTLVNNVETIANVAAILDRGPQWFREMGTVDSPGTLVCTVSGAAANHGVAEFAMGTSLRAVIDAIAGAPADGRRWVAAMSGVANALVPAQQFDTPLTYEAMRAIGSGLGAAGFILFDDRSDLREVAAEVSRFLAVESCGQCSPCKADGLAIAAHLDRLCGPDGDPTDLEAIDERLLTITDSARCALAAQHQVVVGGFLRLFPADFSTLDARAPRFEAEPFIAPITDLVDGRAVLDLASMRKQPDWSHDAVGSGKTPVDRLAGPDRGRPQEFDD